MATLPTCAKFEQALPWQRSIMYAVIEVVSVEAVQLRLIWVLDTLLAARLPGAVGGEAIAIGATPTASAASVPNKNRLLGAPCLNCAVLFSIAGGRSRPIADANLTIKWQSLNVILASTSPCDH